MKFFIDHGFQPEIFKNIFLHKLVTSSKIECFFISFYNRFFAKRSIKDKSVAERALSVWPNIVKLIVNWERLPKSKRLKIAKYQFFRNIVCYLTQFLELFQTDSLIVPFLAKIQKKCC